MSELKFAWDGSNIGSIDKYLKMWYIENDNTILILNNIKVRLFKYENGVPLVADELKELFGLNKVGRHRANLYGKDVIICKYIYEEFNLVDSKFINLEEIRKIYVFRWILGLTINFDTSIITRKNKNYQYHISYRDVNVSYKNNSKPIQVTKVALKKYFNNDWNNIAEILKKMIFPKSILEIRLKLDTIIRRVDPELVSWIVSIMNRIVQKIEF